MSEPAAEKPRRPRRVKTTLRRWRVRKDEERRTAHVGFKCKPSEFKLIEERATVSGNSVSEFCRIVMLSDLKAPVPALAARLDPEAVARLSYEISKVGTNLNQLAKRANQADNLPQTEILRSVCERIAAVLDKVHSL